MKPLISLDAVRCVASAALMAAFAGVAGADVVTDWNVKAGELIAEAKLGTPPAVRVMALVQTAVYDSVNTITQRYPAPRAPGDAARGVSGGAARGASIDATHGASIDAAVAAAHRVTLARLMPAQQASVDAAYRAALALVPDGRPKTAGVAVGEQAAAALLAARANDSAGAEAYRPHTTPGVYVPTAMPAVPQWPQRTPWLMKGAAQFRPAPPPALSSELWARDYNEVKALGSKVSARRSAEQTEIARFWEYSLPAIYHGVVRSVANAAGRDVTRNARLLAAVAQGMDDAMISVFDAKYHYNFWRPSTAIRNGDIDANDATERDASWTPFIDVPMHPEYPSAHSILAATVATVLEADAGAGALPVLTTASPTAGGAQRRWTNVDAFIQEVGNARIYDGVHYRFSTDAGAAMGRQIGALVVARHLDLPQ